MPPSFPQSKLATHDAVTIAKEVLQELLRGILTPERMPSPVDAYLTEEQLFCYRNPHVRIGTTCALGSCGIKPFCVQGQK